MTTSAIFPVFYSVDEAGDCALWGRRGKLKLTVANSITEFRKLRTYKYDENHFYDQMVRRLLKDKLHTDANLSYSVTFASRGNSDRTAALRTALEAARDSWCKEEGLENSQKPILVKAVASHKDAGLQAVDYFLWALQRTYERREDRYIKLLWSKCKCVWDCDDTRDGSGGIRYTKEKPLTAAFLPGI